MKSTPSDHDGDEGVMVSEDFQKKAHQLVHKASKHEIRHLHDRASAREEELRKEDEAKKPKSKTPETFSAESEPA